MHQVWPTAGPRVVTFRDPSPLLIFQVALIPGSLLIGFLLSPLLYLSRHTAQRRARQRRARLLNPSEDQKRRLESNLQSRFLALGFYLFSALIIGGVIGMWTRLCLDRRDPWLWVFFWILKGKKAWTRPVLLGYWGVLVYISVVLWNRQFAKTKRFRHINGISPAAGPPATSPGLSEPETLSNMASVSAQGIRMVNQANEMASELLDVADKHVPKSINSRRKVFHGLAVIMFLPGIVWDVSDRSPFFFFRAVIELNAYLASFDPSFFQRRLCIVHVCGIRSIFRTLSVQQLGPPIFKRIYRPERQQG